MAFGQDLVLQSVPSLRKEQLVIEQCWDTVLNMQADSSIIMDVGLDLLVQNLASETPIFEAGSK